MNQTHTWWRDGVIYQIYPRSFQDSNNDGIGDLQGIIQRLDYLKDLGIDGIWLSPINPSPDVDFGYDVSDYLAIDPKFGTLQDFEQLLQKAHQRNIHIILDLVLNHTSDQHYWFQESLKSKDNPFHDWYIWRDPAPDGDYPNNWLAIFGGSGWEYNSNLNQYYYHTFCPEQPDLNFRNPQVREAVLDVFRTWLERGVDGFRLDVFNAYFKHRELRDNPRKRGVHLRPYDRFEHVNDCSQPEMFPFLQEIRRLVDQYPDRYVVGETFLASPVQARMYIAPDLLHAGFDYAYANSPWSAAAFGNAIAYWDALHGEKDWPNYFLNNHDNPRSATRYVTGEDDARLKLLACMHLTVRGTPYLYYGEEIGMRDTRYKRKEIQDPVGKRKWLSVQGRDGCRSPMQWDASANAGFSPAKPWLRINPNFPARNVQLQESDPQSLLSYYRALIRLRRENPALHSGRLELLPLENESVLVYWRHADFQHALVVLNFSNRTQQIKLPALEDENRFWKLLFDGGRAAELVLDPESLSLPAYGTVILLS
jgi:alpha-glucosidase